MTDFSQESMIRNLIEKHGFHSGDMKSFLDVPQGKLDIEAVLIAIDVILRDAAKAVMLRAAIENENLTKLLPESEEERTERQTQMMNAARLDRGVLDDKAS